MQIGSGLRHCKQQKIGFRVTELNGFGKALRICLLRARKPAITARDALPGEGKRILFVFAALFPLSLNK